MEQDYHPGDSRTVNQIRGCGSTYLPGWLKLSGGVRFKLPPRTLAQWAWHFFLSYEFSQGLLSPRMLGLALLILCIGIGVGAGLLIKKSAKEFAIPPMPPGTPGSEFTDDGHIGTDCGTTAKN